MKQLTKKQRAEIYFEVAQLLQNKRDWSTCRLLSDVGNYHEDNCNYDFESMFIDMKEFELFRPEVIDLWGNWWETSDYESRIWAMLLCYEMCQP